MSSSFINNSKTLFLTLSPDTDVQLTVGRNFTGLSFYREIFGDFFAAKCPRSFFFGGGFLGV